MIFYFRSHSVRTKKKPTQQSEEVYFNSKAVPPVMKEAEDVASRDSAKADMDKTFLTWFLCRHLSSLTTQKLPGISGFISLTGKNFLEHLSTKT